MVLLHEPRPGTRGVQRVRGGAVASAAAVGVHSAARPRAPRVLPRCCCCTSAARRPADGPGGRCAEAPVHRPPPPPRPSPQEYNEAVEITLPQGAGEAEEAAHNAMIRDRLAASFAASAAAATAAVQQQSGRGSGGGKG